MNTERLFPLNKENISNGLKAPTYLSRLRGLLKNPRVLISLAGLAVVGIGAMLSSPTIGLAGWRLAVGPLIFNPSKKPQTALKN